MRPLLRNDFEQRGPVPYSKPAAMVMLLSVALGVLTGLLIHSSYTKPPIWISEVITTTLVLTATLVYLRRWQRTHRQQQPQLQALIDELTSTKERLEYAERAGHIGVFDWNPTTGANVWTEQMNALYGFTQGQFDGTFEAWSNALYPEDLSRVMAENTSLTDRLERHFINEFRIRTPNGETRWIRSEGAFDYNEHNKPCRVIGVSTDITQRKLAEEQSRIDKERFMLTLEAGSLGFWDWHIPSGKVQFQGNWASMLGYKTDEIEPNLQAWERLVHPDDIQRVQSVLEAHLRGETNIYETEHRLKRKDGSWCWILDRGRVVERDPHGHPIRALGIHADINEQIAAREALKAAAKRKDEFLATLAHELRNPLNPMRTGLEIIRRDPSSSAARDARQIMERQLAYMVRLIDDLLDVSRFTHGVFGLQKERTSLTHVVDLAVESSKPALEAAQHTFALDLPEQDITIEGDVTRLSQVISNLLLNAAKYTPNGGNIRLTVKAEGKDLYIIVQDNGLGIPSDKLDAIFEIFGQVSSSLEHAQGGLGIGLSLVKTIVELHGGSVHAESAGVGKGSTFTVKLPILEEIVSQKEHLATAEIVHSGSNRTILVADDNVDGAMTLKMYLQLQGHAVEVTHTGTEALEMIATHKPDLVFLDIGLPGMSGYEVARRARALPHGMNITLIAVTGWGSEEARQKSLLAKLDLHLTKPIDLRQIDAIVAQIGAGSRCDATQP